jgi:hypothetical protein
MKTLRFEVPHFCSAPARSSPKQSSHKNIHYLLVALATVSVFALGAQASTITEDFSTPSTQAQIDVNYPQWSFIPVGQSDTVTVAEGRLRLGGDGWETTQFQLKTAPVGAFMLDVDLGAFPGNACLNIGIQVGPNEIVFHPGFPGTAFRVDGPGGFFNIDIGFTLAPEVLHHFNLISDGGGLFTITLKDSLNDSNVYSTSFSNPAAVGGSISIRRAGCQSWYGEVHADNLVLHPPECTPPPSGIVSWWPGDGNANDIAGGNHGMLYGATFTQGMVGQAFSFDGVDDYVETPAIGTFNDLTIETWVFAKSLGYLKMIRGDKAWVSGALHYEFNNDLNANQLEFAILGTDPTDNIFDYIFSTNTWYHIVTTYSESGKFVRLYVNGNLEQEKAYVSTTSASLGVAWIGGWDGDANRFLDGVVDELTIYNRVLNTSEIQTIYNAGRAGKCKGALVQGTSPAKLWIGLKNSDDQGTQFDLRADLYINNTHISTSQTLCITGVTRNPSYAKEVTVPFGPISDGTYNPGDILSLRVLTRIGTNADGSKCSGPGGSHNNAVGLRLYYDSPTRPSKFGAEISPDPMKDYFLHSSSGNYFLNDTSPTGTVKYKDSSSVNYNNGNPWKEIGTWNMTLP